MKPFYFGESARPLFGTHHPCESAEDMDCGVVLCASMGQEAILAHRAFRLLASRLARAGFHVLRFDYHGCGDSSGSDEDGSFEEWQRDICSAMEEIRDATGVRRNALVGLRLGASLAALAGGDELHGAVLWEPVVDGGKFLDEIVTRHNETVPKSGVISPLPASGPSEALGFPITPTIGMDLMTLDLSKLERRPAQRVLIVEGTERDSSRGLVDALQTAGAACDSEFVDSPAFWAGVDMGRPLVPMGAIECVADWLTRICR